MTQNGSCSSKASARLHSDDLRLLADQARYSIPTRIVPVARELLQKEAILAARHRHVARRGARFCREQRVEARRARSRANRARYLSKLYNDFWMGIKASSARTLRRSARSERPSAGERATITVGPNDVVTTAHNRLRNAGFSHSGDGRHTLIGNHHRDDILRFAFGRPERFKEPVRNAMTSTFLRVDKTLSINNLVAMLEVCASAAVMDGDRFLGLITRSDVLNYLRRQV